jgi:hypothetical protein
VHTTVKVGVVAVGVASLMGCGGGSDATKSASSGTATSGSAVSTGAGTASTGSGASSGVASSTGSTGPIGSSGAAKLAARLRAKGNFLIGMGNDLANDHNMDGAYTVGPTLDLHYAYLVGLPTQGGWPDWNPDGAFVNVLSTAAQAHGVTPMYSLYMMAADGDGNISVLTNDSFMSLYWQAAKLLFQRIAMIQGPAVVHIEPDFWGYAIQKANDGTAAVHIAAFAPDCAGVTEDVRGMGECFVKLRNKYATNAAIGFHYSTWGADVPTSIAFFKAVHAQETDFIATDMLDRDAGCFEAHTDPNCMRTDGPWYWDETNQTHPNFHDNLATVQSMTGGLALPMLWWQVPFGVPSTTPGGTAGHYRDNRVHYIFSHIGEFMAAGGVGAVFGTGAANQTYITTDNGQFKSAATAYFASPQALP